MAFLSASRYSISLVLLVFYFVTLSAKPLSSFSFKRFDDEKNTRFDSKIALYGDAKVVNGGSSVEINRPSISSAGKLIYRKPIKIGNHKNPISFSTYFSFTISPENGDGLTFMILPKGFPLEAFNEGPLGIYPGLYKGGIRVLAVEFDTSKNVEFGDPNGNHVGIDLGTLVSAKISNVSSINLVLSSGQKLHSWIDYDASSKHLEVRLCKFSEIRPKDPLISYQIDLLNMWKGEEVFVGIGSSSGNSTQTCSVYSWSFRLRRVPTWMHSEPLNPRVYSYSQENKPPTASDKSVYILRILTILLLGTGFGALAASIVLFLWAIFVNNKSAMVVPAEYPVHPVEFGYEKIKVVTMKTVNDGKK